MAGTGVGAEAELSPRAELRQRTSRPLSRALRHPGITLIGGLVVFALVVLGIWFFGSDHFQDLALPPPEEIKINEQGVQEFTLVITPDGYNPIHFSVKQGVPVKMAFRMFGEVGCGNTLIFPVGAGKTEGAVLKSEKDKAMIEFTPQETGDFQFFCGHHMFVGVMTVRS